MNQVLLALVLAATVYVPETIDSVPQSGYTHVAVRGVISGMHLQGEAVAFRLTDPHGHFLECLIPAGTPVTIPSVGKPLVVSGTRKAVAGPDGPIVSLDPVEKIDLIEE